MTTELDEVLLFEFDERIGGKYDEKYFHNEVRMNKYKRKLPMTSVILDKYYETMLSKAGYEYKSE